MNDEILPEEAGDVSNVHADVVVGAGPALHKIRTVKIIVGPWAGIGIGEAGKGTESGKKVLEDQAQVVGRGIRRSSCLWKMFVVPSGIQEAV